MSQNNSCCDSICFALKTTKVCSGELCATGGTKVSLYRDNNCSGAVGPGDSLIGSFVVCNGAQGDAGATGPACSGGGGGRGGEYGYIYNLTGRTVANESPVIFDSNGPLSAGITHSLNSSTITIVNTGIYKVVFSVSGLQANQFALTQNNVVIPGTIYGSGAGTQQNTGQVIVSFAANDTLRLINHTSSAAVALQTLAGGTQINSNASILITKIA